MADVTVEIDKERVFREVADRLVQNLHSDCKTYVQELVRGQFTVELRALAKKHFAELFETLTFVDGKTFRQYLEDLVLKPNRTSSYPNRPRLPELLDNFVHSQATTLFHEIVAPHLADVKKKLMEAVLRVPHYG